MDANDNQKPARAVDALWRQIEQRLPKCVRDDPKTEQRAGFLLGFTTGKLACRVLRKLIGGGS